MGIKFRTAGVATTIALAIGSLLVNAPAAQAVPKSVATVKEYKKIKTGQSLSKAQKIIGGKGERSGIASDAHYPWVWRGTGGKDVYVTVYQGKVTRKWRVTDKTVTSSEYKKIKRGQSYKKVKAIIREKGTIFWSYDNEKGYFWSAEGCDNYVTVLFVRNKVSHKNDEDPGYWPAPCSG